MSFTVEFVKVKGHADNPHNNLVDSIAVAASQPINANQVDTYYEAIAKEADLFSEIKPEGEPVIHCYTAADIHPLEGNDNVFYSDVKEEYQKIIKEYGSI